MYSTRCLSWAALWKSNAHGKKDDGVKELDKEDEIKVKDVAELVAEALPDIHHNRKTVPVPAQREDRPLGPIVGAEGELKNP